VDAVANPYSPGAGRPPATLVGRDEQLTGWDVAPWRIAAGGTALTEGVSWDDDALELIVAEALGYPTSCSSSGRTGGTRRRRHPSRARRARRGLPEVCQRAHSARRGILPGSLGRGPRQTSGAAVPARDGADGDAGSSSGLVAERLGKKSTNLGPTRANLIAMGLVYAPEHGVVAFTVPAMAAFIRRQPTDTRRRGLHGIGISLRHARC
jgi:hypothetical protein